MTRAALVGLILEPPQRRELEQELAAILPGTPEQISRFLDRAEEAVDGYRKLAVPASAEREGRERDLKQLAAAGRSFAAAVARLGPDTCDLIEQWQWSVLGRPAEIPRWASTQHAAQWATITAEAADRGLAGHQRRSGPKQDRAIATLVADLAMTYGAIFGEQPSAAREGLFARALGVIIAACELRDPRRPQPEQLLEIGESRLASILDKRWLPGRPPKRGRKATP